MSGMEQKPVKQIMYGVTDFALMRNPKKPAYFVDHTDLIRELEKTRYALFLRPRRFGKSLLCAILQAYYDVDYAPRFKEFFGGLKIGENPTGEQGRYLVLTFDFSAVVRKKELVERDFDGYCADRIDAFVDHYRARLPRGVAKLVKEKKACHEKLNALVTRLQRTDVKLYVIIDEYDNFTNTILADSRAQYEQLCHGDGFFKFFFAVLKAATTGDDAAISRLFITGVSPVTMDDVTSGFNIGSNISMDPKFAALSGFTENDIREMLAYYRENADFEFDVDRVFGDISDWYDHYRFSVLPMKDGSQVPHTANSTLVLSFMRAFLENGRYPPELIDENLRTDYRKIRHLITESRKINGNFHKLEDILRNKGCTATLVRSFQARDLARGDNFVSLLYYFGLLTIARTDMGEAVLKIPNRTVDEFMHDFVPKAYEDVNDIDPRLYDIAKGMTQFSRDGDWRKAIDTVSEVVSSYWRVRDAVEGERVIQTAFCANLHAAHGPYVVTHEAEANGGFADIAFEPNFALYPEIGYAALIELKYFDKKAKVGPKKLAQVKKDAAAQLERYAADHDLANRWRLSRTVLKRIVVVFKGDERVACEEV